MLNFLLNISIVILIIGILVFVHELGHLIAAKLIKAKVFEFAIGFGPKLFSKKIGETEYSLRLLPLGGFVNILGESHDEELEKKDPERSLRNKSGIQKIFVMIAGVFMNFVLACIIYFFLLLNFNFQLPISPDLEDFKPIGGEVVVKEIGDLKYTTLIEDMPASKAGLPNEESTIKSVDGNSLNSIEFRKYLSDKRGKIINLEICKDVCNTYPVEVGEDGKIGMMLIDNSYLLIDYSDNKVFAGFNHSLNYVRLVGIKLSEIFGSARDTGDYTEVVGGVSGPIGLYLIVDQLKEYGVIILFEITASLSLTLVIMNLLPIPALDGGRILLVLIEMIIRKPLNKKFEAIIINVSFILLMILMFSVIIKDIVFFNDIREFIQSIK